MKRVQDVRYRGGNGIVSIYNVSVGNHATSSNIWIESGPHYLIVGMIVRNPLSLSLPLFLLYTYRYSHLYFDLFTCIVFNISHL